MSTLLPRNVRLLVEYDGTPYVGWQMQAGLPSIQRALMEALQAVTQEEGLALFAAGRTDAGVHAFGQVVNFFTAWPREARRFAPALNYHLPDTIRVHRAEEVAPTFNARRSSVAKTYRYCIYQGPHPPALARRRAWHVRRPIDLIAMRTAADHLLGERDFEAFRSAQCDAHHAIRTMHSIDIDAAPALPAGTAVALTFHANAFCRHMCRILAGTLLEVGVGTRPASAIPGILLGRDRKRAGMTAPPWGLTLLRVFY